MKRNSKTSLRPSKQIGCTEFGLCVYNSLESVAPLPIRLAAVNEPALTEWVIKDMARDSSLCSACDVVISDTLLTAKAFALTSNDDVTMTILANIDIELYRFMFTDELSHLRQTVSYILELAKNPEYGSLMGVLMTALHTHYEF